MTTMILQKRVELLASFILLAGLLAHIAGGPVLAAPQDKERWERKYGDEKYIFGKAPISFLVDHLALLPKGKALDIAMGEGRNGVYLATQGFDVTGLDISEKGLAKARKLAAERGVSITTHAVDLQQHRLEKNAYDVVLCTYYLQRELFPQISQALKSGGVAVVETYTLEHRKYRPRFREEYLLRTNELLEHFRDLEILRYQFVDDGKAAYASILARKP